ncbi:hypothetical protein DEJ23_14665 [Curtobacterium sp. MCSS17_008]|uniref:hypothetical protein n=1 Tax=Curtobacterium sp. MCSS17_008 TaxID=2175647 RepID=UPI000DA79CFF|nr:hypothetical protein [Curtobacterium sp. MCSS17_008]PZF53318.1 hypothetical protein DEJ23_14665 [Curtobacterium sp. MCSS17_008]
MGDERQLTEPVLRPRPEPTQFTKDARWLVVIVVLCIVFQQPGSTWGTTFVHAGQEFDFRSSPALGTTLLTVGIALAGFVVAVARRGARRFDEHTVMGLALAGVLGVTVAVWLLMPLQMAWVQWAVEHGQAHPFVLGDVVETTRSAHPLG